MAFTIFTLLVTRVHYSIDIVGGFIFAHLFWILTERYVYIADYNLAGMPLPLRLGNDDKTIQSQYAQEKLEKEKETTKEDDEMKKEMGGG